MSFRPGVPLPMTRPLYAPATVPSGTMMVQMAPVRPVTMVPVSQVVVRPVMRPIISQPQGLVPTIQAQPMPQMMSTSVMQSINDQIWIQQSSEVQKNGASASAEETKEDKDSSTQENDNEKSDEPSITVFVGNISDRASDTLVRQMLMKCGPVFAWKRVQGTSGKLQAFGFCEYKDPESALRALYVLRDFLLGDKKLLVKVDAKTQNLIDEWKKEKGISTDEDSSSKPPGADETRAGLNSLIQEYATDLSVAKPVIEEKEEVLQVLKPDPTVRESQNIEENLQELELEEDQKNFISKEIRSFRETQKLQEKKKSEKDPTSIKHSSSSRSKDDRDHSSRDKGSSTSRSSRTEREERDRRARSPPRRSNSRRRSRSITPRRRSPARRKRSRTPVSRLPVRRSPPRRTRTPPPRRRRSSSRSPVSWRRGDDDDDYEAKERRKLEKKIKEKEAAYQERLRLFEGRERRQKRLYEKRAERQETERKELVKEAKRLREFLADYEDDRSDAKYYVGNSLAKRLKEREREIEADEKDRKKEKEEIEILRKRLIEENHADPDAAIAKVIKKSDNIWTQLIEPDTPPRTASPPPAPATSSSSSGDDFASDDDSDAEKSGSDSSESNYNEEQPTQKRKEKNEQMVPTLQPVKEESMEIAPPINHNDNHIAEVKNEPIVKIELNSRTSPAQVTKTNPVVSAQSPQFAVKTEIKLKKESTPEHAASLSSSKRRKLTVSDVFNQDEEEDELPKKRKLVPLHYTDEERKAVNPAKTAEDERKAAEVKRKMVRALIERIPTQKDDLFDYTLDWSMVDNSLMEKRIRPWITKKIVEYIGEEEPTLVEFICSKIMTKSSPEKILEDISMVLDDEADVFVVKMWRLLIYETEAKKEGLTK